jgi:hypothetical protein
MPYTVVREDLLANLKEKCQQIKEIVAKGGKPGQFKTRVCLFSFSFFFVK